MKLSDVKKLCSEFDAIRKPDGKLTCRHKITSDLCRLPNHFLCDVVSKKRTPDKYISVSRIKLWEECQRKWALRYFYKVAPPMTPNWKIVGRAFALIRAKIDAGQPWEIPADVVDDEDRIRLRAIMRGYSRLPKLTYSNEDQLYRRLPGIPGLFLLSYLDGLSEDKETIYEWKYAADPKSYNTLSMQMQGGGYLYQIPTAKNLMLCVAKKPTNHKPRKGESLQAWEKRLNDAIEERPSKWFIFKQFLRAEFDLPAIVDQMETRYRETEIAIQSAVSGTFWPNFSSCKNFGGCDYKAFCKTHTGQGIGCKSQSCSHPDLCAAINRVSF